MTVLGDWEIYERFVEHDRSWREDALCSDMSTEERDRVFFPTRGASIEPGKAICSGCPVREQCLEYALRSPMVAGIWGGTSQRERHALMGNRPAHRERKSMSREAIRIRVQAERTATA